MRSDPAEEGGRWIRQAEADLRWARHLAEEGGYHIACFLSQQVAEKALKGFLYAQGMEVVLGHSVERLSAEARKHDASLGDRTEEWGVLDGYYVPTRYPNSIPDSIPADVYTRSAAKTAVELAEEVLRAMRERV